MTYKTLILILSFLISTSAIGSESNISSNDEASTPTSYETHLSCNDSNYEPGNDLKLPSPAPLIGELMASACCKICTKGKACGNSCIAKSKTCHKGKGCACDG